MLGLTCICVEASGLLRTLCWTSDAEAAVIVQLATKPTSVARRLRGPQDLRGGFDNSDNEHVRFPCEARAPASGNGRVQDMATVKFEAR